MGLDVTIYFKAKPEFDPVELSYAIPQGFVIMPAPSFCDHEGATHELATGYRYYSEGYERGPWPLIAGALMALLANEDIEKVWHGSDCGGETELKPEDVLRISAHYMANGTRPYHNPTKPKA